MRLSVLARLAVVWTLAVVGGSLILQPSSDALEFEAMTKAPGIFSKHVGYADNGLESREVLLTPSDCGISARIVAKNRAHAEGKWIFRSAYPFTISCRGNEGLTEFWGFVLGFLLLPFLAFGAALWVRKGASNAQTH